MDQDAAREADEAAALRAIDRERLGRTRRRGPRPWRGASSRAGPSARRRSRPPSRASDRCVEIKILRRVRAESSRRPRRRRDARSTAWRCGSLTTRFGQHALSSLWHDVAKNYRVPPTHRLISTQVDRAAFAPAGHDDRAFDDAPLRAAEAASGCVVHLSAPSIYAAALEALGLDEVSRWRRQLSFLNLGSGSGYLSALAAALLGEGCVHVCVELDAALAARSRATLAALGAAGPCRRCGTCRSSAPRPSTWTWTCR